MLEPIDQDRGDFFHSDRAIQSEGEDELGTAKFARDLATAMKRRTSSDSLVIALHGAWGSGKSSIKNMCLKSLEKDKTTAPLVMHFNPWLFSGQEKIFESFFNDLSALIGAETIDGSAQWAERVKSYGCVFDSGIEILPLITGMAAALVASTLGGDPVSTGSTGAGIGAGASSLLKSAKPLIAAEKEKIAEVRRLAADRPLDERKRELRDLLLKRLEKGGRPIWVVIDDVDRLTPKEMLQTFQVVKTMADFPGVHYLLLFDRTVVDKSLTDILKVPARQFLQKIVQVELDMPTLNHLKLSTYLDQRLFQMLSAIKSTPEFDTRRWEHLVRNGLKPYFRTPRNIHRYLNSVSFYLEMLTAEERLEVNPVDLFTLDVLRVFEPTLYGQLYAMKHLLAPEEYLKAFQKDSVEVKDEAGSFVKALLSDFGTAATENLKVLLFDLFPYLAEISGEKRYNNERADKLFRQLRIAHSDHFNKYFHFARSQDELSASEIAYLKEAMEKGVGLRVILESLDARGLLFDGLACLESHVRDVTMGDAEATLIDVLSLGEQTGCSDDRRLEIYKHCLPLFRMVTDLNERDELLAGVLKRGQFTYMPCLIVLCESNSRRDVMFSEKYINRLRKTCLAQVRKLVRRRNFPESEDVKMILRVLRDWAKPDELSEYVTRVINDSARIFSFLELATIHSTGGPVSSTFSRSSSKVNLDYLRQIGAVEELRERLKSLDRTNLSKEQEGLVELFNEALANYALSDDHSGLERIN